MSLQCVILAGGLGTRIRHLFPDTPKALIPINNRPFISYQLEKLMSQGIRDIVIATGYMTSAIEEVVKAITPTGMAVTCIADGQQLLGTGGSLRRLIDLSVLDDVFFVTYGDSYLLADMNDISSKFDPIQFKALMTVHRNQHLQDTNNALILPNRSVRYKKGLDDPTKAGLTMIDYGLSIVQKVSITEKIPLGVKFDLSSYMESLSDEGFLQGCLVNDDFYEIGSPNGLHKFSRYISHQIC